jgi:hypothetical protein
MAAGHEVPDYPPAPDDLPEAEPVTPAHDAAAIVAETGQTVKKQSKGLWAKIRGWFGGNP